MSVLDRIVRGIDPIYREATADANKSARSARQIRVSTGAPPRGHFREQVLTFVRTQGRIQLATVTAFQIPGLKIWFWSNDHEPPHFHVKRRGEWEVKVTFMLAPSEMIEVLGSVKPSQRQLKALTELAVAYRLELLEQWQQIRESEASR